MSGELLWVHIGQCGTQIGGPLWKMLREDHEADPHSSVTFSNRNLNPIPRNLFVDTDPSSIEDLRSNEDVIATDSNFACDKESSGSLYPRGLLSPVGRRAADKARSLMEKADHPAGIVLFYGSGGGTGSGLTTQVSARLYCDYPKLRQIHFVVSPNPNERASTTSAVEPYNVGLMSNELSDLSNCCCLVDNDALYHVSCKKAFFCKPNYEFINKIISMGVLVASSGWRLPSSPSIKFEDLPTNLVLSPALKYSTMSLAPVCHYTRQPYEMMTTGDLTRELLQVNSYLSRCDPKAGAFSACIAYRGQGISAVSVSEALGGQVDKRGARFVSWVKPSFKIGITEAPLPCLLGMNLPKTACMLTTTRGLAPTWGQLSWTFDTMFGKRAFLHWYLTEGTEYSDFKESSSNLKNTLDNYALG